MKHFSFAGCMLVVVGLVVSAFGVSMRAQDNSSVGSWELNVAKSKFSADPAPKSVSLKIEAAGMAAKTTVDAVAADGAKQHWTYTAAYDGVDVPVTGTNQYGDMASRKRISGTTTETTFKKAGKMTFVNTIVVSADSKMLTVTSKGADAKGAAAGSVMVYDRQ
jgi:hypothetical protein